MKAVPTRSAGSGNHSMVSSSQLDSGTSGCTLPSLTWASSKLKQTGLSTSILIGTELDMGMARILLCWPEDGAFYRVKNGQKIMIKNTLEARFKCLQTAALIIENEPAVAEESSHQCVRLFLPNSNSLLGPEPIKLSI
jgi:hypothetical protein